MASRVELQTTLEKLLDNKNVYYQPPESIKMEYPCIRYSKNGINVLYADDKKYRSYNQYQIIVIDRKPDNVAINKILELPLSSYERHYISDNLHHDVINIYY